MTSSVSARHFHPIWFAIALPCAWLLGLLSIGILQLFVDPDAVDSSGEFLDQLSWYLWLAGSVIAPLFAAIFARRLGTAWPGTIGLAAGSALLYALGTILVFAVWVASYQGVTGMDWR